MKDITIVQEHLRAKDFPDDAVQNVTKKLLRHPDILKECAGSIEQRGFPADGISVFGYTAEHLMVTFPHAFKDIVLVYSFLAYFRENHEEALKIINLGFPIM